MYDSAMHTHVQAFVCIYVYFPSVCTPRKEINGHELSIQKSKIMASGSITSWQIHGEAMETVTDFIFFGSQITATKLKALAPWKKSYDKPRQHIKKQRHYFTDKGLYSPSYGFFSNQVWMCELDHKED